MDPRASVVVADSDPDWPLVFERLRAALFPAFDGLALAVEHVGSTAVPGLAAKPVIDLDVVVRDHDVPLGIARLESLGYVHRGDLGVAGREAFDHPAGMPKHHLYLCAASSPALANHLAVRDHLRTNAHDARAYGQLKRRLAVECGDDRERYVTGKTGFLLAILRRRGFDERTLRAIEDANRGPPPADPTR